MIQGPFYRRIAVWNDTEKTAPPLKGPDSTKYVWDPEYTYEVNHNGTLIGVVDKDFIDCAKVFFKHRPLVVNPADDCFPGGCVATGSGAGEESLFRRSNYFRSLTMHFYPIKADEAVYSPNITVFKESEDADFETCEPFDLDFVACPGLRHPNLTSDGKLKEEDVTILEKKIEVILQIAQKNKHSVIIMAALGCGAWKNPPRDVAETFKRVLEKYDGVVKAVLFAVKRNTEKGYIVKLDPSRPDNYSTFKTILTPPMHPKTLEGQE